MKQMTSEPHEIHPGTYQIDSDAIEIELNHLDIDEYLLAQLDKAHKSEEQIRIDFQALKKVRTLRKRD